MLANESWAVSWVLQWDNGKIQSVREGLVIIVMFRLGPGRLDDEDSTNRHSRWLSNVSGACHALPKAKTTTGCVERCRGTW